MSTTYEGAVSTAQHAKDWPTIAELAQATGIRGRTLRQAAADGRLNSTRTNVTRIDPDDFARWFAARQRRS